MSFERVRPLIIQRAHGICEGCGQVRTSEVHHRQARGMGGVHGEAELVANAASNLLAFCGVCHGAATAFPDAHKHIGWVVPHPYDPADIPVLIHTANGNGWYLLGGDLAYTWVDPTRALPYMRALYGDVSRETRSLLPLLYGLS